MTEDPGIQASRRIHDALSENGSVSGKERILVRWATVCDWQDANGDRCLTRICSEATTEWELEGLLWAGMQGGWDTGADEAA